MTVLKDAIMWSGTWTPNFQESMRQDALTFGQIGEKIVFAYGSRVVAAYYLESKKKLGKEVRLDDFKITQDATALGLGQLEGYPVLITGCASGAIFLWNLNTGHHWLMDAYMDRNWTRSQREEFVEALALRDKLDKRYTQPPRDIEELSRRLDLLQNSWSADDLRTELVSEILTAAPTHKARVSSVQFGELAGETVIVSGSQDHHIKIWPFRNVGGDSWSILEASKHISIDVGAPVNEIALGPKSEIAVATMKGLIVLSYCPQ
jgi:WD40 repeat protein